MSILQKSAPALIYGGIVAASVGAAALSVAFHPVAQPITAPHPKTDCKATQSADIAQQVSCTMRHGYHFSIR